MNKSLAFIFPGQGAQFVGMGRDVYEAYPSAREIFEQADDLLKRNLAKVIFQGPESELTRTDCSQLAIFVTSVALLKSLEALTPELRPAFSAGLSLGEYTALYQSERLDFPSALALVEKRGRFMSEACDKTKGTMAVVMGMDSGDVEALVDELNLPRDLWAANFNCPGQVVISGTEKGIEAASREAKIRGARRVLRLPVHGAFHSGLMAAAKEKLAPFIESISLKGGSSQLVMNVSGRVEAEPARIKQNLIDQVTSPVRWQQCIETMKQKGALRFVEIGPGKTLSGMNKRIGVLERTINIEKIEDLSNWEEEVKAWSRC